MRTLKLKSLLALLLVLAALALLLVACGGVQSSGEPLPTLFFIPTLTPSVSPTVTLFVTATPTLTLTPAPSPSLTPIVGSSSTPGGPSTAVASGSLRITYFTPTPSSVSPGGSVTLAWATSGATQATIFRMESDGSFGQSWQVDPTGTLTIAASGDGDKDEFVLRVSNGLEIAEAQTTVNVSCNRSWFYTSGAPDGCPSAGPVSSLAAEQPFEHGTMIWIQYADKIYVLYDDGSTPAWEVYEDTWVDGEAETDPAYSPPSGNLLQPRRGIGKVWRANQTIRDRLGWALNDEQPFGTTFQQEAGTQPHILYVNFDDQVVQLKSGGSAWNILGTITTN